MSIEPATDKEIAYQRKLHRTGLSPEGPSDVAWIIRGVLFQRIEYDRECIASLKAERSQLREQFDSAFVAACLPPYGGLLDEAREHLSPERSTRHAPSDEVALVAICSALWMEVISLEVGRRITSHVQRGANGFVSPESCLERRLYPVQKIIIGA